MPARKLSLPSLSNSGRTDHYLIGEMSDLFDIVKALPRNRANVSTWAGSMERKELLNCIDRGHMPSVAASEEYLAKVENLFPCPTARHEIINDVCGAVPDVPAMLAGFPLAMRRKVKRVSEASPLAIVVNTTTSANISPKQMEQRGAAILALVRALSSRRPVELYTGTGLDADNGRNALWQLWKIETAPLDIARAAFLLSHVAATRNAQYQIGYEHYRFAGHWPYSDMLTATQEQAAYSRALPHVSDMLYVPAAQSHDGILGDTLGWIAKNVAAYGDNVEAAA